MKYYRNWFTFVILFVLLFNLAIAIFVRTSQVKVLQGQYLVHLDSYLYDYQAKIIIREGRLPERDNMRYVPFGVQNNQRANLNAYALAYFYQFLRLFIPSITLERAAIAYPVFCFTLALIAFTLLVDKLFSRAVALLAVTMLAIVPALVPNTMAGVADRDALTLLEVFLVFYFYVWAAKRAAENVSAQLLLAAISGIITGILALTWPGVGIIIAIIVLYNWVKILLGEYGKRELYLYISWYLPAIFIALGLTRAYTDVSQPHVILAVFVPTAFLGIALATVAICGHDVLKRKLSLSNRIPVGLAVSLLALLLLTLLIGVASGPGGIARGIQRAGESFLYPIFGDTPLARSIDEMRRMTIFEWWHSFFGFLFLFITGAIVSVWDVAGKYKLHRELLTASFILMLQTTFISSISAKPPLDGHTTLSNVIYIIPILGLFGLAYTLYLRGYPHREIQEHSFNNLIFTLVWFTTLFFCTRAVFRFRELFTPAAVILSAYAIVKFLHTLGEGDAKLTERLVLYMVIGTLCWETLAFGNTLSFVLSIASFWKIKASFGPYIDLSLTFGMILLCVGLGVKPFFDGTRTGYIKSATFGASVYLLAIIAMGGTIAKPSVLVPPKEWIEATDWIQENTPENAVFAAYWDNGNWILALAQRATLADNTDLIPHRIYLQDKHLFRAQNEAEALAFLFTHKATHLLIDARDLFKISKRKRGELIHSLYADKSGIHFSTSSHIPVKSVDLSLDASGELTSADINVNGKKVNFKPKLASSAKPVYLFSDDSLKGGVAVIPVSIHHEPEEGVGEKRWNVIYLSEIAKNNPIIKLYFLEEINPYFHLVYPAERKITPNPLEPHEIKIWELNYPAGIKENPDYLLLKDRLYFWQED